MIVVISNPKGGTGKSSVALNLISRMKFDQIIDADVHRGITNLVGLAEESREVLFSTNKNDLIKWCDNDKMTLIDCGGFDSPLTQMAIALSDVVITPSNDDPTEQFGLMKFNQVLETISKDVGDKIVASVLITKVHHSRKKFPIIESICEKCDHLELLPIVIPFSAKIPDAAFAGSGVKHCSAARRFDDLCELIKAKKNG